MAGGRRGKKRKLNSSTEADQRAPAPAPVTPTTEQPENLAIAAIDTNARGSGGPAELDPDPPRALMNSLVIERIGRFLPPKDLASARAVCKQWYEDTLPEFRRRHPMVCVYRPKGWNCFERFAEHLERCNLIPYSRYNMTGATGDEDCQKQVNRVVELCGQHVTSLAIRLSVPESEVDVQKMHEFVRNQIPNLTELEIFVTTTYPSELFQPVDQLAPLTTVQFGQLPKLKRLILGTVDISNGGLAVVVGFLKGAVNLEYLRLPEDSTESDEMELWYRMTSLGILRAHDAPLRTLSTLKMSLLSLEEMQILIELSQPGRAPAALKLKKISTSFNVESALQGLWLEFLELQSSTLEHLTIGVESESSAGVGKEIVLPYLRHLETLKIKLAPRRPKVCVSFGPGVCMEDCLPALKQFHFRQGCKNPSLTICYPIIDKRRLLPVPDYPLIAQNTHSDLGELKMEGTELESLAKIKKMVSIFPHLRTLKINLKSAKLLPGIWRHCSQLEELYVNISAEPPRHPTQVIDTFITGIPIPKCKDLAAKIRRGELQPKLSALGPLKLKTKSGIRNMAKLRILHFEFHPDSHKITDVSGYYGFGFLTSLISFQLKPSGKHGISSHFQTQMKETLGLAAFVRF